MKFRFVAEHAQSWPVRTICRVLGVSASGYYAWRDRPDSARTVANQQLLADLRRLHAHHHGRYGSPRMHAALRAEGRITSRGRVERLMRASGLRASAARRFRPVTTDSRHSLPVAPNLLDQRFEATVPNQVWLADITYLPTSEGWLYLATVLDLATRKVVGWSMREHMRAELTCAALMMAIQRQHPAPGLLHHSDSKCAPPVPGGLPLTAMGRLVGWRRKASRCGLTRTPIDPVSFPGPVSRPGAPSGEVLPRRCL